MHRQRQSVLAVDDELLVESFEEELLLDSPEEAGLSLLELAEDDEAAAEAPLVRLSVA